MANISKALLGASRGLSTGLQNQQMLMQIQDAMRKRQEDAEYKEKQKGFRAFASGKGNVEKFRKELDSDVIINEPKLKQGLDVFKQQFAEAQAIANGPTPEQIAMQGLAQGIQAQEVQQLANAKQMQRDAQKRAQLQNTLGDLDLQIDSYMQANKIIKGKNPITNERDYDVSHADYPVLSAIKHMVELGDEGAIETWKNFESYERQLARKKAEQALRDKLSQSQIISAEDKLRDDYRRNIIDTVKYKYPNSYEPVIIDGKPVLDTFGDPQIRLKPNSEGAAFYNKMINDDTEFRRYATSTRGRRTADILGIVAPPPPEGTIVEPGMDELEALNPPPQPPIEEKVGIIGRLKNLISSSAEELKDSGMFVPSPGDRPVFKSREELDKAMAEGRIEPGTKVIVNGVPGTAR